MKTVSDIQKLRETLATKLTTDFMPKDGDSLVIKRNKEKQRKIVSDKLSALLQIIFYLETNPSEESISRQLSVLFKRKDSIINGFDNWLNANANMKMLARNKMFSKYKVEMNIKDLQRQIDSLEFILKSE